MGIEQFLIDFHQKSEKVLVYSEQLEEIYRTLSDYEMVCKSQQKTIYDLQNRVLGLEAEKELRQINDYITVDLRA